MSATICNGYSMDSMFGWLVGWLYRWMIDKSHKQEVRIFSDIWVTRIVEFEILEKYK